MSTVLVKRDQRFAFLQAKNARVSFCYPNQDGTPIDQPLVDISVSGMSFALERELPLLSRGAVIAGVLVRIGDCEMRGKLLIKHVTRNGSDVICGAVFYPASEIDMNKLNGMIAGISAHAILGP
jgi:hypothetical protein